MQTTKYMGFTCDKHKLVSTSSVVMKFKFNLFLDIVQEKKYLDSHL